jgi:replication-associated recombination protein RarA
MKLSQLKELVKQVVKEEHDYQQLFKHMLDKTGKAITDMSDEDKKKFFNAVDTAYKAKSEGRLTGYNEAELTAGQKKIDTDGDGEIEGSDLAALRAKNESVKKKK